MKYINRDDLISIIQDRLFDDSIVNDTLIADDIESKVIELAASYIAGKYDIEKIFAADAIIRNGVLVQIIASIVVYRCIRRNAARKVPEDYINLYSDSIKQLEKIQLGAIELLNCPKRINDDGTTASPIYGNNTNNDFFI